MSGLNQRQFQRKDEKLPLAIAIHFNFYLSCMFAFLIGRIVFEKYANHSFCNSFQRSLLVPVYCAWVIAEVPRLYVGQKGILRDKLPEMSAFFLLSVFPQIWIVIYLSFLQEIILPFDSVLGVMMLVFIVVEIMLAWRFLRSMISRQHNQFYHGADD